jgi:drug/metabolite transporter (DMT)-like permease
MMLIVFLTLTWGFNQVAVKLALSDFPPFIQAALRSCGGALVVWIIARLRGVPLLARDATLVPGLAAGLLFAAEFILIFQGLLWTTATRSVLFIYFAPFFVVIGARWLLPADRFDPLQWLGLALSFAGLVVAFGLPTPAADPRQMLGDLMMVLAAIAWAATTLTIKASALTRAPFEKTMLYQLVISGPLCALAALAFGEHIDAMPSALAWGSLLWQSVWVVGVTYTLWFMLMQHFSASRLSAFSFLTPLFGVAAGHFVLSEPVTPAFLAAVGLVIAGLFLVNRARA